MSGIKTRKVTGEQAQAGSPGSAEQEILRAIASIEYGSVEVVIHDGRVVQIECREKIRLSGREPDGKNPIRPIR